MSLLPTMTEKLARARADLRLGLGVVLTGGGDAVVAIAAEVVDDTRLNDLRALGPLELALTARRAQTLKARAYDGDLARVMVPGDVDRRWVRALADPADDLMHPMKGPLHCARGGNADLHRAALTLAKQAQVLPAILIVRIEQARGFAADHDLNLVDADLAADLLHASPAMSEVVHARLPLTVSEAGRLHIYRPEDGSVEHYAVEIGQPPRDKPVLARLHSACFTGDVLGSLKCDCGPQLNAALAQMAEEGAGVLLYLNQEGRGIGLANKMRAYSLQDQGFDTVEANHRLGFEDDERDFEIGAAILREMGFDQARLMTNNPNKIKMLEHSGIQVTERVPLKVGLTRHNEDYLATKARKSGHML